MCVIEQTCTEHVLTPLLRALDAATDGFGGGLIVNVRTELDEFATEHERCVGRLERALVLEDVFGSKGQEKPVLALLLLWQSESVEEGPHGLLEGELLHVELRHIRLEHLVATGPR